MYENTAFSCIRSTTITLKSEFNARNLFFLLYRTTLKDEDVLCLVVSLPSASCLRSCFAGWTKW